MGITGFWSYITDCISEHGGIVHTIPKRNNIIIIDANYYLYSPGSMDMKLHDDFMSQPNVNLVCGHDYTPSLLAWSGILNIIQKLKLNDIDGTSVFVVFDGRPPTNKYYTQHSRRRDNNDFISSFTPYSPQAVHLETFVREFLFTDNNKQSHYFKNISVLSFIGPHVPGEGEYKAIEILNDRILIDRLMSTDGSITVVSDDSDIIMNMLYSWGVVHEKKYDMYIYRPRKRSYYIVEEIYNNLCKNGIKCDIDVFLANTMFLLSLFKTDYTPQLKGFAPTIERYKVIFFIVGRHIGYLYESVDSLLSTFEYLKTHIKRHLHIGACPHAKSYISNMFSNIMWHIQYMRHMPMDWKDGKGITRSQELDLKKTTPVGIGDVLLEISEWSDEDVNMIRCNYGTVKEVTENTETIHPDNKSNMWYLFCVHNQLVSTEKFAKMYLMDSDCITFFRDRLNHCSHMSRNYCDPVVYQSIGTSIYVKDRLTLLCNTLLSL